MNDYIATRDEVSSVAEDAERHLNELRKAINSHAEILSMHRYLLEKFIPEGLLESACNEYYKLRQQEIAKESGHAAPAEA